MACISIQLKLHFKYKFTQNRKKDTVRKIIEVILFLKIIICLLPKDAFFSSEFFLCILVYSFLFSLSLSSNFLFPFTASDLSAVPCFSSSLFARPIKGASAKIKVLLAALRALSLHPESLRSLHRIASSARLRSQSAQGGEAE